MKNDEFTFFVSSTFRDFQMERDLLHLKILPALNAMASQCGAEIHMVDLRWGVNTEDFDFSQKSDRVLDICLNEIQRCKPYYIVFLGDRYGWIPEKGKIKNALTERMDGEPDHWSVTEMEIRYEMFLASLDRERVIVCMRDSLADEDLGDCEADYLSRDAAEQAAMSRLKDYLERELNGRVIHYSARWDSENRQLTGLDDFQQKLTDRLKSSLEDMLRPFRDRDIYEQVQDRAWRQMKVLAAGFTGRKQELESMRNLLEKDRGACVVHGEENSGKSALLAAFALSLRESGDRVFVMPCGHTPEVSTMEKLQEHIIAFLERQQGKAEDSPDIYKKYNSNCEEYRIENLLARKPEYLRYILILDGLDHLLPDIALQHYSFLGDFGGALYERRPVSFYLYISEREKQGSYSVFKIDSELHLRALPDKDSRELIENFLKQNHKLIDRKVQDAILAVSAGQLPFYTKLLMLRLLLMDGSDLEGCGSDAQINEKMIYLINDLPKQSDELCEYMENLVGNRLNPLFCRRVFGLLNLSSGGMSEQAMENIFRLAGWEWNTLAFSELIYYVPYLIGERPGRYFSLIHRLPVKKVPCEILAAFVQAMVAEESVTSENLTITVREGLRLAWEQNDRVLAAKLLTKIYKYRNNVKAGDMLISLSEKVAIWLLKVLEEDAVDAETCVFIGHIFSEISEMFTRDDMQMPTYQAINVRACILAYQKSGNVECIVLAQKEIREIYMSLGARWMNDNPEALPPFYRLDLELSDILLKHGLISQEKNNLDKCKFLPNIMIGLKRKDINTMTPLMPFMGWKPWEPYETYIVSLLAAMKTLFQEEYRCKIIVFSEYDKCRYSHVDVTLLEERFGIRDDSEKKIVLGNGECYDIKFVDLINECFSAEEAKTAVEYLLA